MGTVLHANTYADVNVIARADPGREVLRDWDSLVDATPGTDVTQLSAWARLRGRVGFRPIYLLAFDGARLVGGAQILTREVPILGSIGYLPYGPVVAPAGPAGVARLALADTLATLSRCRLRFLFVQPAECDHDTTIALLRRGFRISSAEIAPEGSVRIDLTEDLAQIRSRFGKRLRSWTNRWASRGVKVRPGDERDLPLLAELMAITARHQGYTPLPLDYLTALHRELAGSGHAVLYVGEVNGIPVAADLMTGCGDMLRGRLSGFDRSGEAGHLSVPAAVRWEMIQWAKAEGYRWFDFGGLHTSTLDALLSGRSFDPDALSSADQPKLTFGGTAFRYPPAVERISPLPLRVAFDVTTRSNAGRRVIALARDTLRGALDRGPAPGGEGAG